MDALGLMLVLSVVAPAFADEARLPLTVVERISACVEVEDSDPARAVALADSVLAESVLAEPLQRAEALGCRGWAHASLEKRDDARRDAHALHVLAGALPTSAERVRLTRRSGGILHRSGDRIGAVDLYAAAVADAEAQGLEAERIPLLVNLGVLHSEFEEHERARVNYEQALALMERLGDFRYEAPVRFNLALNLSGQDRDADALPHLRRTLELMHASGIGGARQELLVKIALANALLKTGDVEGSRKVADEARAMDPQLLDASTRLQLDLFESERLASAGDAQGALAILDRLDDKAMSDTQRWDMFKLRARLLEQLGRFQEEAASLRKANALRETYLRNQNHERLAALDAHLRDREQRAEPERLQVASVERERQMRENARLQWIGMMVATTLLLGGAGMLLWQRRMNKRLYLASRTDPLTGLANRRAMADRLRELSREPDATALLLIDIDHFKRINDERGHDMGDEVLVSFAERLRARAGAQSMVARWGGEEFLVVLPHSDVEASCAMADKLRHDLSRPIESGQGALVAEVSIGIANLPLPGAHPGPDAWHASLQLADSALYLAKRSGRDAWVCYWIDRPIADWPAERLGSEAPLARSLGLITPRSSRPLRDALSAVAR
jgi:diguanylate cyclase (GGDEF)-like protein